MSDLSHLPITYKDLLEALELMPKERLQDNACICSKDGMLELFSVDKALSIDPLDEGFYYLNTLPT